MTNENDLKPCPFCGGEAALEQIGNRRQSTIVACTYCGARHECGEERAHGTSWNTRALPAAPVGVKSLEWRGAESDCFAEALVDEGCYQLTISDSLERPCDYAWVAEYSENGRNPFTIIGHGSFADVVQIANQHRSTRILAALQTKEGV